MLILATTIFSRLCFLILLVREYIQFIDFAYPELDATSKPNYTAVEGYDRNLKVFVPFFATVHNVVYTLLVEVLEKDVSRFHSFWLKSFFCFQERSWITL